MGIFLPTDNALYSIAFGTHTAEPIEMPFWMMTRVGCRYYVLDGTPSRKGKEQFCWENIVAHRKVLGHPTVSCAKMAQLIDMLFWMRTRVSSRNHVLDRGAYPQMKGQFWGLPGPFKSIGSLFCSHRSHVLCKRGNSIIDNVMQMQIESGKF